METTARQLSQQFSRAVAPDCIAWPLDYDLDRPQRVLAVLPNGDVVFSQHGDGGDAWPCVATNTPKQYNRTTLRKIYQERNIAYPAVWLD